MRIMQRGGFDLAPTLSGRTRLVLASLACCLVVASAQAQQPQHEFHGGGTQPVPHAQAAPPEAEAPPPSSRPGFLDALGRWIGNSKEAIDSQMRNTQETLGNIGSQAKDAAGSVVAIPGTRVITGRQLCPSAANGAPDCQQGVDALCRNKGFQGGGRTLEVASAQRCSAKNLLAGGTPKESLCRTETYVTRAVCQ